MHDELPQSQYVAIQVVRDLARKNAKVQVRVKIKHKGLAVVNAKHILVN